MIQDDIIENYLQNILDKQKIKTETHDAYFLTCNYFIASDYVSRRSKLIKTSHHQNEFLLKIKKLSQISKKYSYVLLFRG